MLHSGGGRISLNLPDSAGLVPQTGSKHPNFHLNAVLKWGKQQSSYQPRKTKDEKMFENDA